MKTKKEKLDKVKDDIQKEVELGYESNPMSGILLSLEWLYIKLFTK